ncbi:MAG: WYL domain-containing protein, partial [Promicromonosporaceae bacterium]|nr:WYL domain-containing protein [Promicromonosporaceae bacterium]
MSETSAPRESVPPAERLLNLVIALVNTRRPMTKRRIRSDIAGYCEVSTPEAFERMFERDKNTLRSLGVPIMVFDTDGHPDDVGYRIDNDAYALPPIDLTTAELGVLALAARLWGDAILRGDTSRALTKLVAAADPEAGHAADSDALAWLAPRVTEVGDAYPTLLEAITERRKVRFDYRGANSGTLTQRTIEPWRITARGGGWYLVGHDVGRRAPR